MVPLSASAVVNNNHSMAKLADNDPQTFYLSTASTSVSIVLDLGSYRWITGLRLTPVGDSRSPKRCVLQRSITSGQGPFETVRSFTLSADFSLRPGKNATKGSTADLAEQQITGFSGLSRFWRLIVVDNHGGSGVGIRELALDGYDESVTPVPFALNNTGQYETYYLPINTYLTGMLLRMRLELLYPEHSEADPHKHGKVFREGLYIDHIRVVRAPEVWKVRGCLEKYYESAAFQQPHYNVTTVINRVNGNLPVHYYHKNNLTLQYASTYDCPLRGGVDLLIEGINFGQHPRVTVGGRDCPVLRNEVWSVEGRVQQITCRLPPGESGTQRVRVSNGVHPGRLRLCGTARYATLILISPTFRC